MMKSKGLTTSSGSLRTRSSAEKNIKLMHGRTAVAAPDLWAMPGFSHSPALTDRYDFGLYFMAALSVYRGGHSEAAVLGSSHTRYLSWSLQQVHSSLQMPRRQALQHG